MSQIGQVEAVSELGVVMLLFLIGLELRPVRLWTMRRAVFGLGAAHLAASAAALALLIRWAAGLDGSACAALGLGLALSSTAIVLPMLAERQKLDTAPGRDCFAVLLFQDLSFIPLVALVPLLAGHPHLPGSLADHLPWRAVGRARLAIGAILLGGLVLLPRLFAQVHPRWQTPWRSNLFIMVLTSLLSAFLPISQLGHMTSIGTLLAFIIVCIGVMILRVRDPGRVRQFRVPFGPAVPVLGVLSCGAIMASLDGLTWIRLVIWLLIGFAVFFGYGRRHSRLGRARSGTAMERPA